MRAKRRKLQAASSEAASSKLHGNNRIIKEKYDR